MSNMITPDFDLYKGKSMAEMINILSDDFNDLKNMFPVPGERSQVLDDDVENLRDQFRKWAEDPELPVAVSASDDKGKQMRKILYEVGSLLLTGKPFFFSSDSWEKGETADDWWSLVNSIYANGRGMTIRLLADQYLNEVDTHLRTLHEITAEAKKKKKST